MYLKEHWIEISALVTSILSVLYAFSGSQTAKKALKLAKKEFQMKQAKIDIYYVNGFRFKNKVNTILIFNFRITNQSDSKNSCHAILEIEYIREDNSMTVVQIEHSPILKDSIPQKEISIFPTDIILDNKTTHTGWLLFEQPKQPYEDFRINKYTIRIIDISKKEKTETISILTTMESQHEEN